jgi:Protein of unknown function (DUF2752)
VTVLAARTRTLATSLTGSDRGRCTLMGAGLVAAAVAAHLVSPSRDHWLPKCPFHELTGLWCPACGSTRAAAALAHGDVVAVLRHNALFLPALGLVLWAWAASCVRTFAPSDSAARSWARSPWSLLRRPWWLLGIVVAFWIVRNVPGAPVHLLSS